jgi:hypothetical protein
MKYYKTDSRKASYAEYWHITNTMGGFLLGAFNKFRGKQMNLTKGIPGHTPFREKIIEANIIPPKMLAILDSSVAEIKQLGFYEHWYYTTKNSLTAGNAYGVQAISGDRQSICKVVYVEVKTRQNFSVSFISQLPDKTYYATTNNKKMFNAPPGRKGIRKLGATSGQLWELHQQALKKLAADGNPARVMSNFDQMAEVEDTFMSEMYADRIRRGLWVEMTEAEVNALRTPPPIPR